MFVCMYVCMYALQVSWDYTIACKPIIIGFVCDLIYVLRVDHLVGLVPELVIEVLYYDIYIIWSSSS